MGDETWYDGNPYIMDIPPYDEDYFKCNLADIKPEEQEEQEEHNYWTILLAEHKSLTKDYSKLTLLNRMYKEVEYNVSNKRILLLFEVKLLIELNMIDNTIRSKKYNNCSAIYLDNVVELFNLTT